jgi:uncharacterized lipoprotein
VIVRALLGVSVASSIVLLTGCTQVNKLFDNGKEGKYERSGSIQSLDLPPDLTSPKYDSTFIVNDVNGTTSVQTAVGGVTVLPESVDMQMKGQGASRHLEVVMPVSALWQKVQGFWSSKEVKLKRSEPKIGIMETDWVETRGHLPQGMIQKALGSILKNATDSGIRDRYTLRFERAANKTNIYMTHRGAEKIVTDFGSKWEMRPARLEASAEMLNQLQAYLQTHAKKAKAVVAIKPKPKRQPVRQTKLKVVSASPSPQLSTPTTLAASVGIKPTLNKSVALSTAGTLGANVVNLPKKQLARPMPKPRPVQVVKAKTPRIIPFEKPVVAKSVVKPKATTKLAFLSTTNDGQPALGVRKGFSKTWAQTASVLKKTGFGIDGKNAKNGLYAIQYTGRKGKKAVIKKGSKQILHIIKIGKVSAMRLLDVNGQPLEAKKATKVLRALAQGFNG